MDADRPTLRALLWCSATALQHLARTMAIAGVRCLVAKHHSNAVSINMTMMEYLALAYAAHDQVGGEVNNEGDQEQEDADGEQYLVVIGAHGRFTQFRGNGGRQGAY